MIDSLPESKDEFWKDAETETLPEKPSRMCAKGQHVFRHTKGLEVKCIKCPTGYILAPGWEVRDGHIVINNEVVI